MDLSFDLVASKCAEQMAKYQHCVLANQTNDWGTICRPEGQALTKCADESVPHLAELKRTCHTQITQYRSCLEKNGSEDDDTIRKRCEEPLAALWKCSEARVNELNAKA